MPPKRKTKGRATPADAAASTDARPLDLDGMDPAALVFIDSLDYQKLVITWPKITLHTKAGAGLTELPGDRVWFSTAEMEKKSGVQRSRIADALPILAAHGIIKPDGAVPQVAVAYVRNCIAKRIK